MKIATQTSPELTHVAKLIEDIPIAMLTPMQSAEAMASHPVAGDALCGLDEGALRPAVAA